MASENAARDVEKRLKSRENPEALEQLMEVLELENPPKRIEGFDVTHLDGKFTVASLISFIDGRADQKNYRRFNIKSLGGKIDDYMALKEAVTRRYTRQVKEKKPLPDLILVDGGKGQVNAVVDALTLLGLEYLVVIGLAEKYEEIHFRGSKEPLQLSQDAPALKLLQAIRDEAHRFANALSIQQRSKEATFALLESIDGVGKVRSKKIMQTFSTIEQLLSLSAEEIAKQAQIPLPIAQRILKTLNL
jgi:excinuclease ABC subunit C